MIIKSDETDLGHTHIWGTRMRWIGLVTTIVWWSSIARCLNILNQGHSYKISPKPCRVAGPGGGKSIQGTCMFVWDCVTSEGTHVGVCVDTFMFGSCCVHNKTTTTTTTETSLATSPTTFKIKIKTTDSTTVKSTSTTSGMTSTTHHHHHHNPHHHHHHTHLHQSTTSINPSSMTSGDNPTSTSYHNKYQNQYDYLNNKPKRPSTLPQKTTYNFQSSSSGRQPDADNKNQIIDKLSSNQRMRPGDMYQPSSPSQNNDPEKATSFTNLPPPHSSTFHYSHPEKQHQDNIITETVGDHITAASLNAIRTEKPPAHWLVTNTPSTGSNFYSSLKTPAYRPGSTFNHQHHHHHHTSSTHQTRPNFVSKPESNKKPTKVWTTSKPPTTQATTTESSFSQTSHWKVTTEPAFVTKQKYSHYSTPNRPSSSSSSSLSLSSSSSTHHLWSDNNWTTPNDKRPWGLSEDGDRNDKNKKPDKILHRPAISSSSSSTSFVSNDAGSVVSDIQYQQNTPVEYGKPHGLTSHFITTSDLGTLAKPKPTRKRTPQPPRVAITSTTPSNINLVKDISTISTKSTLKMTTSSSTTSTTTSTSTTSTTTTTTTTAKPTSAMKSSMNIDHSMRKNISGSIPTVSAVTSSNSKEPGQCGVPPLFPRPETRIVGGKDAPFGRWPWQVSVRRTSFFGFSSTHRCGGAVLNENWIATAGHCVDDLLTSQIRIRVGDYDFSSVQEKLPYVEKGIAKKIVHPKYNFFTYEHDLALVKLENSLVFAPHISPICLPATDDLLIGENATVTGWGRLSEGGTLPSVLQEVSVPIVSNDRCKSMFLRAGRHEFIPDIFLCAGYENGGQDSCQGDSGGPLQVRGKNGRYFLAGIISWGIGCAEANLPGVCTRISKFVPWILKNVT